MTSENQSQLVKRFKSLLWRAAMMGLALLVEFALNNLGLLDLSPQLTVVIGLVLGEVSKWINTGLKPTA
jgi:hypothetical protein